MNSIKDMLRADYALLTLLFVFQALQLEAQKPNDLLVGIWEPVDREERVLVKVFASPDGLISGKIIGGYDEAGNYQPVPAESNTLLVRDFEYVSDGQWKDGQIIDPEDGDDYRGRITLLSQNKIEVRAYYGFLWKDMEWVKTNSSTGVLASAR